MTPFVTYFALVMARNWPTAITAVFRNRALPSVSSGRARKLA